MPHIIEAEQGDSISGKISRAEVAQVISQALDMPAASGKGCIMYAACGSVHQSSLRHAPKTIQQSLSGRKSIPLLAANFVCSVPFGQTQCMAELHSQTGPFIPELVCT